MSKTLSNMRDDTWKLKGHKHDLKDDSPVVCPHCMGKGFVGEHFPPLPKYSDEQPCYLCNGEGVIYE